MGSSGLRLPTSLTYDVSACHDSFVLKKMVVERRESPARCRSLPLMSRSSRDPYMGAAGLRLGLLANDETHETHS